METSSFEKATFAAGCFWGIEEAFGKARGVVKTRVGYTGGRTQNPTYKDVCNKTTGHAEAVEVTFDPSLTSYSAILAIFFKLHDAGRVMMQGTNNTGQYRSAIFVHSQEQQDEALQTIRMLQANKTYGPKIYTQVAQAGEFWEAEAYHQKYYCRNG